MPRWTNSGSDGRCESSASGVVGASQTSATGSGVSRSVDRPDRAGQPSRTSPFGRLVAVARCTRRPARARLPVARRGTRPAVDERHAAIVDELVGCSVRARWDVAVEVTFSIYGERGSIDVFAIPPDPEVVAVNEVKASRRGGREHRDRRRSEVAARAADRQRSRLAVPGRRPDSWSSPTARRRATGSGATRTRSGRRFRRAAAMPRMDPGPGRRAAERNPVPRAPEWALARAAQRDRWRVQALGWTLTLDAACGLGPGSPVHAPRSCRTGAAGVNTRDHSGADRAAARRPTKCTSHEPPGVRVRSRRPRMAVTLDSRSACTGKPAMPRLVPAVHEHRVTIPGRATNAAAPATRPRSERAWARGRMARCLPRSSCRSSAARASPTRTGFGASRGGSRASGRPARTSSSSCPRWATRPTSS